MCNFLSWNYWSLVFWGKWSRSDSEFGPVCKHVTARLDEFPRLDELDLGDIWFQHAPDGATAHTSRASMAVLKEHFPERLISIRGDLEWPARSPDLTPCDFFLWGFLKSRVYVNRPSTLEDLKTNIQEEIANITPAMLARVMTNARNRFTQCMENGGRHLSDLIFKTM